MIFSEHTPCEQRKVQKKHFKDLCQCLCFKKRPKNAPCGQKIYRTPSNSRTQICENVACGVIDQVDTIKNCGMEKKVSKKGSQKACGFNYSEQSIKHEKVFSDSDSMRGSLECYR